MASISKMQETRDGRRFWKISVSRGYGKTPYTTRFYWPEGWSKRATESRLKSFAGEFEQKCNNGEVLNREQQKELDRIAAEEAAQAAAEKALLKTVKQYASSVFMPKKEQSISENTRLSYWSNLNEHIFPAFGDCLIKDVSTAMINALLLEFQKTHSYGSAVKVYNICNGIFGMAFRDDTIPINPMLKVERPAQTKEAKAVTEADKALFEDELLYVLECVAREPIKWQAFLYVAADTGARRGELCGLQWSDIDLNKGVVTFKRNLQYSKAKTLESEKDLKPKEKTVIYDGVYVVTPKSGKFRTVDIGEDTIAILKAYKTDLTKDDEDTEESEDNDVVNLAEYRKKKEQSKLPKWLFTKDGEDVPMFPTSPTRYFKTFGETYNVPGFHPHLLRHTSATLSLTNGGDAKSVADRLGHKDASILLKVYVHANDESVRSAGQAARDALRRKKEEAKKKAEENTGA